MRVLYTSLKYSSLKIWAQDKQTRPTISASLISLKTTCTIFHRFSDLIHGYSQTCLHQYKEEKKCICKQRSFYISGYRNTFFSHDLHGVNKQSWNRVQLLLPTSLSFDALQKEFFFPETNNPYMISHGTANSVIPDLLVDKGFRWAGVWTGHSSASFILPVFSSTTNWSMWCCCCFWLA